MPRAALGCPKSQGTSLLMGDSAFPDWIFLLQGVKHLCLALKSTTYAGPLKPLIAHGEARWRARWNASHVPQHANSSLLQELQTRVNATVADASLLSIYNDAIEELRMQLSLCLSEEPHRLDLCDAFMWQFTVVDSFLPLLKEPTQEAAAIFAHFCIILKRLEGHWWLQGWATVLISKVWRILDSVHRPWIQWAIEEMGWVPP